MPRLKQFINVAFYRRLYYTIRPLKWQQVFYRLYYPLQKLVYRPGGPGPEQLQAARSFPAMAYPYVPQHRGEYQPQNNSFLFLNKTHAFGPAIDWEFRGHGLLWTYTLHYFDWLADDSLTVAERLGTMHAYVSALSRPGIARDSYPASLRIVNWIRFLSANQVTDELLLDSLYRQGQRLIRFPEYHLMGNHLLENRITCVWLAMYFEPALISGRLRALIAEMSIQILDDGAHYERSIMYHVSLWTRLLELSHHLKLFLVYIPNDIFNELETNLLKMFSWIRQMAFSAGNFPHFGDSCEKNVPDFRELNIVAQNLLRDTRTIALGSSGYRRFAFGTMELLFNCGGITPSYQPGHAHADLFSFCLNTGSGPLITDTGIATYEPDARRLQERGTAAHNTVVIAGMNSSDVWRSFRVGKRAVPVLLQDSEQGITATHDGYLDQLGILHERQLQIEGSSLIVTDHLQGWNGQHAVLYLHFYPGIELRAEGQQWHIAGSDIVIRIEQGEVHKEEYDYCVGFNERVTASRLCAVFKAPVIKTFIEKKHG